MNLANTYLRIIFANASNRESSISSDALNMLKMVFLVIYQILNMKL